MKKQVQQRLNKLKQHQNLLMEKYLFIKENYFLLEPLLYSKDLFDRFTIGPKARGFHLTWWALYCNHILEAWKITSDKCKKTLSLSNQICIIKDQDIISELREQYSEWPSAIDESMQEVFEEFEKKERDKRRTEFDDRYKKTLSEWRILEDSKVFKNIRKFRNKFLAHNEAHINEKTYEFKGLSIADLKYGNERQFLECLQKIVVNLDLMVRQSSFQWEDFDDKIRKSSLSFWDLSEGDYEHKFCG